MIEKTESVTIANGASYTYTHNLGYVPAWVIYEVNAGETHFLNTNSSEAQATTTTFKITNDIGSTLTFRYYLYRLPLTTNFAAPIFQPSVITSTTKDKDIGVKVLKPGKKIASTDLRDYNYHSGTRAPMIHAVTYAQATSQSFTDFDGNARSGNWVRYINNLGYVPIFLGYFSSDGVTWSSVFGPEQSPPKLFVWANGDMGIQTTSASHFGTIIAFKDPYSVGAVTTVNI